jgi:hypothetical protein
MSPDILNNPTFLIIVGAITPLICVILTFIFRKVEPSKDVRRWIGVGLVALTIIIAIFSSRIYLQWHTVWDWVIGIGGALLYYELFYKFVIKMLPESWRNGWK